MAASTPGNARGDVTMQQVAEALGVSVSTVSLAFRDSPVVALATRERVRAEAERLGYVYHRAAANLRRGRSSLIGLVVPTITNPFVAELASGVQDVVAAHGFALALANSRGSIAQQREITRMLAEQRAAGAILIPMLDTPPEHLGGGVPFVLVNRDVEGSGLPFVHQDDVAIVDLAADHLLEAHDVRTLGYFGGLEAAGPRRKRLARFRERVGAAGKSFAEEWATGTVGDPESAYRTAKDLLGAGPPPEALLCHSDELAWSVLRALAEAGVGPDRCRVIGIDGIATSAMFSPALTTVSVDAGGEGRHAGAVLLNAIGVTVEEDLRPRPPYLEIRESCGC
ncbi:LacI family transcriptional regulator [Amycolatopsis acidicola]|uniref:LacI family transcriptional regulator n=1 Tax=Amycolatopsis acidicola TaxID=2596893 RepID=A0A5N0V1F3_9PSEU|nr:LacI family DNA-binding transcriptional regulator [Amycolatopsis acidicola]KAA9159661.1 LacI family transcriptional regulator [Amycolatopsis acidicola]